jgi:hypothetical protein
MKELSVRNKYFSHDYIFSNYEYDIEPFGPWNKYVGRSSHKQPFNIFINSRLYVNNEEFSFLYKNHHDLRYLIPSSVINLKEDYIYPEFNVISTNLEASSIYSKMYLITRRANCIKLSS